MSLRRSRFIRRVPRQPILLGRAPRVGLPLGQWRAVPMAGSIRYFGLFVLHAPGGVG